MGINTKQLIELIIQPTLKGLDLYSPAAEQLLALTCAQESNMGTYLAQFPVSIAKGIYQMEDATHDDIRKYCDTRIPPIYKINTANNLIYDLRYATLLCRLHYLRVKEAIPQFGNIDAMWDYYKQYYNTPKGAATRIDFLANYAKYVKSYYEGK